MGHHVWKELQDVRKLVSTHAYCIYRPSTHIDSILENMLSKARPRICELAPVLVHPMGRLARLLSSLLLRTLFCRGHDTDVPQRSHSSS